MGKYSKLLKKVEFGWRLAENGWADTYCKECGWTKNHDVHVYLDYKYCPGCGGSVTKDRFKYDVRRGHKHGKVICGNCEGYIGRYGDADVARMKFCPHCGDMFRDDDFQQLFEEKEL